MSDNMANLPKPGEQIVFEGYDSKEFGGPDQTTVRVNEVRPHGFGMVRLVGWRIGGIGFPDRNVDIEIPVATVEARRLHRRER